MTQPQDSFWSAVTGGAHDAVRQILARAPELASVPSPQGVSPLLTALYHRHPEVVAVIRKYLPSLSVFEAAALGEVASLTSLLDADPSTKEAVASDGFFPLALAAFFGRLEAVDLLLVRGASVSAVASNENRVTALHAGAASNSAEIVGRLLQAGADPNATQAHGYTALHSAASQGNNDMVRVLLAAGARKEQTTEAGKTAAQIATERGFAETAKLLS